SLGVSRVARLKHRVAIGAQRIGQTDTRLPVIPGKRLLLTRVIERWKDSRKRRVGRNQARIVVAVLAIPAHAYVDRKAIERDRVLKVGAVVEVLDGLIEVASDDRTVDRTVREGAVALAVAVGLGREAVGPIARPRAKRLVCRRQVSKPGFQLVAHLTRVEEVGNIALDLTGRTRKCPVVVAVVPDRVRIDIGLSGNATLRSQREVPVGPVVL